ncbi:mannose receptor, C type 2 (predicted) [Rattus norvegicus]|uniref:Secretory phospholipase A2 receptor n=4 Tax=Rattus TaxID=10114 RepID=F1M495_RAT|nr:secretory phospholipase A2 receptor precursor [Rattus norvegicus]EDM00377.1 mannose receptor, C type 2 (predicted) [Rattus norvegicus]|eukprot:NP_001094307.1 secretory phospholipase A2 receptor precursor [Rattus norvegicus]
MAQWLAMLQLLWLQQLLLGVHQGSAQDLTHTQELALEWRDKGIFIIQSESLKTCIQAGKSVLTLENCTQPNEYMLWKWVSDNHLFNVGASGCLGLNISDLKRPLSLYECDSTLISLRWLCDRKTIVGPLQYKVQVNHSTVVAKKTPHKWSAYMPGGGDICEHLHRDIYTLKGNAHGMPCVFPFQFKGQWHHECIREGHKEHLLWCATTSRYEEDEKWGFCPDPTSTEIFCDAMWQRNDNSHICYQFNLLSSLSWNEAHSSCQMQGGALLSITDENEEAFIRKELSRVAKEVWTGLNQLDEMAGWQWSDGTPLSYLNWSQEVTAGPFVEYHCGTLKVASATWRSMDCESTLPYICKRHLNHTAEDILQKDSWKYHTTHCDPGWTPFNRKCYKLKKEKRTWQEALHSCQSDDSMLMDVTSLAEVELLVNLLGDENASETWIGLSSNKIPVSFAWSSGSSVIFTNWYLLEPRILPNRRQLCVSADQSDGRWKVKGCKETLPYICKKAGQVLEDEDSGCQAGWERHGKYCYKIDTVLRSFEQASGGYYCPPALLTITSRFEQAFITSLISSVARKDSYFWIALQDQNNTGEYTWKTMGQREPVQYTHWNAHQPSYHGGCVVLRGGSSFGRWEVKNCSDFKAMSLCKTPIKVWEKTEFEGRWPFHPCYMDWESETGLASCFKVFHSEKVLMKRSWREAEAFCEEFGAHLASFAHIEEENFVNKLLHSKFNWTQERQFWIGFNKRNPLNAGSWEWSDGSPVVSSFLDNAYFEEDAKNCAVYKANNTLLPSNCASKHEWICKIPRDVKPNFPVWYQYDAPWLFYQNAEYLFHTHPAEWATFEFVCGWLRSDFLTIYSAQEQEFIHSKIRALSKYGANWWIGLEDRRAGDQIHWSNGSPVIFQNWDKGRKGRMDSQRKRCVFMSAITGLWGTENCSVPMPSICKRVKIWVIEKEKPPTQHGTCPKGWLYFNYKCFLVTIPKDPRELKTWTGAQEFCAAKGGTLVSIESELEQAFITVNLFGQTTNVWIGLQSDNHENWVNGKPVVYSNWSPSDVINIPNYNTTEVQKRAPLCALMSSNPNFHFTGKWYFDDCGKKGYGFVCEKMQDTLENHVNVSDTYAVPSTLEYGNRTYKIIRANMTWYAAGKSCRMQGAELVSIPDVFHQSFLTVLLSRLGHAHWIGLSTPDNGLNFDWSDGTKSPFTYWKDEESASLGDCVFADTDGHWHGTACESHLQGAVCRVLTETKSFEHPVLCSETSVPWIRFKGHCYSFSTVLDSRSFEDAREFCKREGSNLLAIKDEAENLFLLEELLALGSSVQMVWLNAQLDNDNKTLRWFDGAATEQSNWGVRKPDMDHLKPHPCVVLRIPEGVWQSTPCEDKTGFICKVEAGIPAVTAHPEKGLSHSIMPVAAALALTIVLGILVLCLWIYKQNGGAILPRLTGSRGPYYPMSSFSMAHLEENILISDLEKNNQ